MSTSGVSEKGLEARIMRNMNYTDGLAFVAESLVRELKETKV